MERLTPAQAKMLLRLSQQRIDAAYLNKKVLAALDSNRLTTRGGTIGQSWVCLTVKGHEMLKKVRL